jgi:acylglycerol lipase
VAAFARAGERFEREFGKITLPVLILHGTEDKATRPEGSEQFFNEASSTDKTLKLYEGYYHDLLNDLGRDTVFEDIDAWISERLPVHQEASAGAAVLA